MARDKAEKKTKEPGRLKQMAQVFTMTRRYDKTVVLWMALGLLGPIVLSVVLAVVLADGNGFMIALWVLAGVLAGALIALIILGRRAERAAYSQIEGQPGAVGAVLKSGLRRGWTGSEMPVAMSPRTHDAVYRAVGKGGVVLIGEGPRSRVRRMLDDEQRNVRRLLPNVQIHTVTVGTDEESVRLYQVPKTLRGYKKSLSRAEIFQVNSRLSSLNRNPAGLGIPKGIDPMRARAQRPR
jgi:ribosomal protein L28